MKARWFVIDIQTGRCLGDGGERLPRSTARLWTAGEARDEAVRIYGQHWAAACEIAEAEDSELMARIGAKGGRSRSEKKVAASKINGRMRKAKNL